MHHSFVPITRVLTSGTLLAYNWFRSSLFFILSFFLYIRFFFIFFLVRLNMMSFLWGIMRCVNDFYLNFLSYFSMCRCIIKVICISSFIKVYCTLYYQFYVLFYFNSVAFLEKGSIDCFVGILFAIQIICN